MDALLRHLLTAPPTPAPVDSPAAWWEAQAPRVRAWPLPVEAALVGGHAADRPAWAFAAGYQAALRALLPALPPEASAALCATEAGGGHPRAIHTRLLPTPAGLRLSGVKTYVTLGTAARVLLVVARSGEDAEGRPRLVLVRVDAHAPGVRLEALPELPFVPELPHAQVSLEEVAVAGEDVLPGDGYARYLKPFRTVEDVHVHAALLGYVLQVARRSGWPREVQEEAVALALGLHALARADASSPATHVALAGQLALGGAFLARVEGLWARAEPEVAQRWERDRPLLQVAGRVRAARREAAWERLAPGAREDSPASGKSGKA